MAARAETLGKGFSNGGFRFNEKRVTRGLGWFSIGLGLTELVAPRVVARISGTRDHSPLIRAYGLREIAAGVGILASRRPAGWMWARVAGDVLDLAALGKAAGNGRNSRGKALFAFASVAGVTALDVCCAAKLSEGGNPRARAEANVIVDRSPAECYRFWRNFENFPKFSSYLTSVTQQGDRRSHWIAAGRGDAKFEWDSEITEDAPNERIAWKSLPNSGVSHSGAVDFERAAGGRGTIVRVQMDYGNSFLPLGVLATVVGKNPEQIILKETRRFKQVMETGEVITTEGQPAGRTNGVTWLDRIAR